MTLAKWDWVISLAKKPRLPNHPRAAKTEGEATRKASEKECAKQDQQFAASAPKSDKYTGKWSLSPSTDDQDDSNTCLRALADN